MLSLSPTLLLPAGASAPNQWLASQLCPGRRLHVRACLLISYHLYPSPCVMRGNSEGGGEPRLAAPGLCGRGCVESVFKAACAVHQQMMCNTPTIDCSMLDARFGAG